MYDSVCGERANDFGRRLPSRRLGLIRSSSVSPCEIALNRIELRATATSPPPCAYIFVSGPQASMVAGPIFESSLKIVKPIYYSFNSQPDVPYNEAFSIQSTRILTSKKGGQVESLMVSF